jgi:hypothetical protein
LDVYYGRWESLAFHHVLLLLGLTESDMPGTRLFVETPAADMAFDYANVFGLVEHPLFLFGRFIVIISRLFDSCPQLQRLSFPFGQLLLSLLLLKFPLYHLALLHQFFLFLDNKALILCIELFSFLLEDLLADSFVLGDAVGVETTSAAHSALLQLRRVVFLYLNSVLTIHLFYRLLLVLLISSIAGLVTRLAVFLPGGLLALALLWWLVLFLLVLVLRFLWGRLVVFWLLIPSPIVTSFIVASLLVTSLIIASLIVTSLIVTSLIVTSFIVTTLLIASLIVAWLVVVVLCLVAGLPSGLLRGVVLVVYIFVGLADRTTLTSLLVVVAVVILKIYVVREILREFTGWRWAALEE